jgi:type I site-specific restriction-modification system R (restriction) subunit
VIVVTDRRLLDKQLRENIKEFSEVKNIVAPAYSSADLKAALETWQEDNNYHNPEIPISLWMASPI